MNKLIAPFLLFLFIACNVGVIYGMYKVGTQISLSLVEEEETQVSVLEVKHYLNKESHTFTFLSSHEEKSASCYFSRIKYYEDVYLASIETPPDFMC